MRDLRANFRKTFNLPQVIKRPRYRRHPHCRAVPETVVRHRLRFQQPVHEPRAVSSIRITPCKVPHRLFDGLAESILVSHLSPLWHRLHQSVGNRKSHHSIVREARLFRNKREHFAVCDLSLPVKFIRASYNIAYDSSQHYINPVTENL